MPLGDDPRVGGTPRGFALGPNSFGFAVSPNSFGFAASPTSFGFGLDEPLTEPLSGLL